MSGPLAGSHARRFLLKKRNVDKAQNRAAGALVPLLLPTIMSTQRLVKVEERGRERELYREKRTLETTKGGIKRGNNNKEERI